MSVPIMAENARMKNVPMIRRINVFIIQYVKPMKTTVFRERKISRLVSSQLTSENFFRVRQ